MSFDPVDSIVRELRRWYLPRRRIERAAELLVAGGGPSWSRSFPMDHNPRDFMVVILPPTERPWFRWDAAPGQRLRLS